MADPTPDFILGWLACREAASNEEMIFSALYPRHDESDGLTYSESVSAAIRALPPPGDLRAALAAMVKPLVWEEKDGRSYRQANTQFGQYQVSWLVEFECWQLSRPHKPGTEWRSWFSRHPNKDEAKVAAEADNIRRVVAAIMGDEG